MRCFIAIDIKEQIRAALGDLQREIARQADIKRAEVKWVRPEAMHLTLKFLGEIGDTQAVDVCNLVGDVVSQHQNFELEVQQVGFFGGRSARVLWVGAGRDCAALRQLQQDLEERLGAAGWPPEARKFTGHLTLCRVRNARAGARLAQMTGQYEDFRVGTMWADAVSVYQSQLTRQGPIYTVLGKYRLAVSA